MMDLKNPTIDGGLCYGAYKIETLDVAQKAIQKVVEDPTLLDYLTVIGLYIAPLLVIWRFIKVIIDVKKTVTAWYKSKKDPRAKLDI